MEWKPFLHRDDDDPSYWEAGICLPGADLTPGPCGKGKVVLFSCDDWGELALTAQAQDDMSVICVNAANLVNEYDRPWFFEREGE